MCYVYWGEPERAPQLGDQWRFCLSSYVLPYSSICKRICTSRFGFTNIVDALSCMYKQLYIPYTYCTVYMFQGRRHGSGPRERLRRRRERERDKRASETPERREERLRVRRERDRARRAIRVANATADATQARLQQLSAAQRARHSAESADQRLARLLQISAAQTERCAAETVAGTEARLDRDRERLRTQRRVQPQPSLLEQPVVRHKMGAFHRHLSKLDRRWRHRYSTLPNLWWHNVSLAVRHFLACSYNLCSLLSVCDVIALFLAQARPTDHPYHLPSYIVV